MKNFHHGVLAAPIYAQRAAPQQVLR